MINFQANTWRNVLPVFGLCLVSAVAVAADGPVRDMVRVPAGDFMMGSDDEDTDQKRSQEYGVGKPLYQDEHPLHRVHLPAFYIDRYEVTNIQYRDFVMARNYWVPDAWKQNGYLLTRQVLEVADDETLRRLAVDTFRLDRDTRSMGREELLLAMEERRKSQDALPVTTVSWQDAKAYCQWQGLRLPTEQEWEKAARGDDGYEFPWGREWQENRANNGHDSRWQDGVAPVGSYPAGMSPYGVHDMAGNVMEWVSDWYQPYPGNHYVSTDFGQQFRVVRGGSWGGIGHYAIHHFYRSAYRFYLLPESRYTDLGFRCARDGR